MEKDRIRQIVSESFAKTFDPLFVVRLESFMSVYRDDLLERYDWYRTFGFHATVEGKAKPTFDLLPLEELMITTISDKIYNEQKK